MKVAVIGNCQIAPIRLLIEALCPGAVCYQFPSVYQLGPAHRDEILKSLTDADFIFSQLIDEKYHVDYVTSLFVRETFGSKVIIWPNIYFKGINPECDVLRDPELSNYHGPLQDYHIDKIILSFALNWSERRCVDFLCGESKFDFDNYTNSLDDAFCTLRSREIVCDVAISDYIEDNYRFSKLFHIMNHPTIQVLMEMALRIIRHSGIRFNKCDWTQFTDLDMAWTSLADNNYVYNLHKLNYPKSNCFRGVKLIKDDSRLGYSTNGVATYDPEKLVDAFYRLYEPHRERLTNHPRVLHLLAAI